VAREGLVLASLFAMFGAWTVERRWIERTYLVLAIPCGYFLIQRFGTGSFAGWARRPHLPPLRQSMALERYRKGLP